jgi:hypothetical protein
VRVEGGLGKGVRRERVERKRSQEEGTVDGDGDGKVKERDR